MEEMKVILDDGAYMPERAYETDAGADLRTPIRVVIRPHNSVVIDTGVHIEIPAGYVGMVKTKSGINVKRNINTEGVIDSGYSGSIRVKMYNHGEEPQIFEVGDKITQIVIMPIETPTFKLVDSFENTDRGSNGFGSTGK